jgi:hypothetical protein
MKKHTFPAGRYYIGDPCYVLAENDWLPHEGPNYDEGLFTYKGKHCFADGTAYGDGCYRDNRRNSYPVDAGLIGILPEEVCIFPPNAYMEYTVLEFKREFEVWSNAGVFYFGTLIIDTN